MSNAGEEFEVELVHVLEPHEYKYLEVPKYGHEFEEFIFCHHCKQLKRESAFARCKFRSSTQAKVQIPSSVVNGVKIYNVAPHNKNLMDHVILKKLVKDKKRRKTFEDQIEVICEKSFCGLCLHNFYDTSLDDANENPIWHCPHCTGSCFCSRCRRQEQLTTAKGFLISLNLPDLLYSPYNAAHVFGPEFN